ncbi:hypothetical protein JCM11641_008209 [Rhodosporidiobolus odoratus]
MDSARDHISLSMAASPSSQGRHQTFAESARGLPDALQSILNKPEQVYLARKPDHPRQLEAVFFHSPPLKTLQLPPVVKPRRRAFLQGKAPSATEKDERQRGEWLDAQYRIALVKTIIEMHEPYGRELRVICRGRESHEPLEPEWQQFAVKIDNFVHTLPFIDVYTQWHRLTFSATVTQSDLLHSFATLVSHAFLDSEDANKFNKREPLSQFFNYLQAHFADAFELYTYIFTEFAPLLADDRWTNQLWLTLHIQERARRKTERERSDAARSKGKTYEPSRFDNIDCMQSTLGDCLRILPFIQAK